MIDYETALLATLITEPSAINRCDLAPGEFVGANSRQVFEAIQSLDSRGEVVDVITVADYLHAQTNRNWLPVLVDMVKGMQATSVEKYTQYVRKNYQATQAKVIAANLIERAAVDGEIDRAVGQLMTLSTPQSKFESTLDHSLKAAIERIDEAFNGKSSGLMTGLVDLDTKIGGLHAQDLVIIGARPAMGKTALLLNMANSIGKDHAVGIFSGEQPADQMAQRLIAINGQLSIQRMRTGKMIEQDWPKLGAAVATLKGRTIQFYDKPAPSVAEIIRVARQWKYHFDVKVIFIDYLQRLKVDKNLSRHEAIGEAARALKELARELDIPVVCLAQVNREVERRHDKRPHMGDLKDCGEIEQEADQVLLLYRDEVYNPDSIDTGIAEILVDKNRHGPVGFVKTVWRGECMRFENMGREH